MKRYQAVHVALVVFALAGRAKAEDSPKEAAARVQSQHNLREIALAMVNYHTANRRFPAAFISGRDGEPLLSWRVTLLPYMDQKSLYEQFHLDEPWDGEHNKALIEKMPQVYAAPGSKVAKEFKTNYLVPHSHGTDRRTMTIFHDDIGLRAIDISDSTPRTILALEASDDRAVIWTKPDDYEVDFDKPSAGLVGLRMGGFIAVFADCSVSFLKDSLKSETLKALFTAKGGEDVKLSDY
jgi:hypothetical protein